MGDRMSRRDFLRTVGIAAGATVIGGELGQPLHAQEAGEPARLVRAVRPDVVAEDEVQTEVLVEMLDQVVVALTGEGDGDAAWSWIFGPEEVVGIKIN